MLSEWNTDVQKAFLQQELIAFKQIGGRAYMKNWPSLYGQFFQQWPECASTLPGMSADAPLTEDLKKVLADAVSQWQKQICQWMHWHNRAGDNGAANNKTVRIIDGLLETKMHAKKLWEIYASIYSTMSHMSNRKWKPAHQLLTLPRRSARYLRASCPRFEEKYVNSVKHKKKIWRSERNLTRQVKNLLTMSLTKPMTMREWKQTHSFITSKCWLTIPFTC